MANQNYQQTEMDLRTNLQQDVDCRVASVIDDTYDMLKDYNPPAVRNRHEAYGIAADNFTRISAKIKSVRNDMDTLLSTLANPNYPAVEAVSSLHNRVSELISLDLKDLNLSAGFIRCSSRGKERIGVLPTSFFKRRIK